MKNFTYAGTLIRMLRLEKNWSQETLCNGICAVSYLSKIEQGRVDANDAMLHDLFRRLGFDWEDEDQKKIGAVCEEAYEAIFSGNHRVTKQCKAMVVEKWNGNRIGPWYLDLAVLHAYCGNDASLIPEQMDLLMDDRQSCLTHLLKQEPQLAMQRYPCALAALVAAGKTYREGAYSQALEYLQRSYDMACRDGYVHLMMDCQAYMANCYSDLQDMENMLLHSRIAKRLARAIGEESIVNTLNYNIAATQMELGDYESAYAFFSAADTKDTLYLHKLAICCERLGKLDEAKRVLNQVKTADALEENICGLVRYRLEHPAYLKEEAYGKLLIKTFWQLRKERPMGYARFHLPWIEEWCEANRQYRLAYETLKDFT